MNRGKTTTKLRVQPKQLYKSIRRDSTDSKLESCFYFVKYKRVLGTFKEHSSLKWYAMYCKSIILDNDGQ